LNKYVKNKSGAIFLMIIIIAVILAIVLKEQLKGITALLSKGSIEQVVVIMRSWGIAAPVLSILLMMFQSIAAPIPAFLISAANGIIFGIVWGSFISWLGAMLGAFLSFFLARYFGEKFVRKMIKKERLWDKVDSISSRQGFKVVLVARLLPIVSFDFISYAAGLSSIKVASFLVSTGIGMLPGTVAYTALGSGMSKIEAQVKTIAIVAGIVIILFGVFSFFKKSQKRFS
jgi:uncharacterized membrane protein YdjX (TVP38/TMEM64 family)